MPRPLPLLTALVLAACAPTLPDPEPARPIGTVRGPGGGQHPSGPDGACWAAAGAERWVRLLCPEERTAELLASLQRALAARELHDGPVTGRLDAATGRALRAYQAERGLDSAELTLGAALQLGLAPYGAE